MRLWFLVLALLCVGVPVAAQTPPDKLRAPGISRFDDRVEVDVKTMPWRAIGKLQTNLASSCTGTLVGPRLVLTAGHCIYHPVLHSLLPVSSLHFLLGYNRGSFAANANVVAIKHAPDLLTYLNAKRTERDNPDNDWLILVIDQPLGEKYGMLKLAGRPLERNDKLQSAGYAQDKSQIMTADRDCQLRGWGMVVKHRPLLVHDCETTHGNSGGPLLVLQDGEWRIAGLTVGIHKEAGELWMGLAISAEGLRESWATMEFH